MAILDASAPGRGPRTRRGRPPAGPVLAAVPDGPPPVPDGALPVPGSAGWAYRPGLGGWGLPAGAEGWAQVLSWCPLVADAVRYVSQDGRTITRCFKITVAGQTEIVAADDLTHGKI